MADNRNFIISGFIAFSLYILLGLLLIIYLKGDDVKKIDSSKKITVLQLDVILDTDTDKPEKMDIKTKVKNKEIAKKVVKKTTSSSLKQRSDLKSLFADVKTSATKVTKKEVSKVKKSTISSRFKSKFEKERKVNSIVSPDLLKNKSLNSQKVLMNQGENENDPYYSRVNQMLSSRWNPTIFSADLAAKISVVITSNGIFSFKFIQYSGNTGFDNQLRGFLEDESLKRYPVHPSRKTKVIEIIFKSEE